MFEKHINIIFKDIIFENNINFYNLWYKTFKLIYPNSKININDAGWPKRITKSFYLCKYFIATKNLDGDFLECGVFKGFSSLFLRFFEENLNNYKPHNYYLIDSFEGLSEISNEDIPIKENTYRNKKGDLKSNFDEVDNLFKKYHNINVVKGWIPEVFDKLDENNKYKFVHIDVDLYKPTLDTLNYVYDKVIKGGIIITDDFQSVLFPGNKKAWIEFFNKRKIYSWISLPSGQAILIKE